MKIADKLFKVLDQFAFVCAAISVGGMLFCVTLQVVARMTALSANWTTELSQYCFLWGTTFASYIAARRGKLIGVELIQNAMPMPVRRTMKFLSWAACAYFYGLVIYYCIGQLPQLMVQTTPLLRWSMGMIYIIMMIGLGLLTIYSVYTAFEQLLGANQGNGKGKEKAVEEILEEVE